MGRYEGWYDSCYDKYYEETLLLENGFLQKKATLFSTKNSRQGSKKDNHFL
jgi:hypothetical protein